jgi:hypothetical protein
MNDAAERLDAEVFPRRPAPLRRQEAKTARPLSIEVATSAREVRSGERILPAAHGDRRTSRRVERHRAA